MAARGKSDPAPLPNSEIPRGQPLVKLKSNPVGAKRVPHFSKRHLFSARGPAASTCNGLFKGHAPIMKH